MKTVGKFRNYENFLNSTKISSAKPNYFTTFQRPGDGQASYRVFISGDVSAQSPASFAFNQAT